MVTSSGEVSAGLEDLRKRPMTVTIAKSDSVMLNILKHHFSAFCATIWAVLETNSKLYGEQESTTEHTSRIFIFS